MVEFLTAYACAIAIFDRLMYNDFVIILKSSTKKGNLKMKKRLLSLLLIATMLVAIFPIGVSAATETVDGTKYTVVSTAKELQTALQAGGNILLKNDIALDSSFASTVTVKAATVLNGNGYTLTWKGDRTAPLFRFAAGKILSKGVGYIKNINFGTKDNPITLTQGNSLFVEESTNTCAIVFQNVDFYLKGTELKGTNVGGLYATLTGGASFYGCNLHAELSATAENMGAWVGNVAGGTLEMTECTTSGSIVLNGNAVGAAVGQIGDSFARFTDCVNMADVRGPQLVAGFLGLVGAKAQTTYFTGCVNYGDVVSTGSGYSSMAAGIIARSSNIKDLGNKRLRVFYDCVNYGSITANRAGGIVGSSHDQDVSGPNGKYTYYTFENCINYGEINGKEYAGGIIGIASPVTHCAEVTDCVNLGKITSSEGYAGNFAGMLSSGVISGGYAAGVVSTKQGTDVLAPHNTGTYVIAAGSYAKQKWDIIQSTVSNVHYVGNASAVAAGITKVTPDALASVLPKLSELCNTALVAADANDTERIVVAAEPGLRGLQQSVEVKNGSADLRLIAGIDAMNAFKSFGFKIVLRANGQTTELNRKTFDLYTAMNAAMAGGSATQIKASEKASNYLFATKLTGLPIASGAVLEVTPYAVDKNGTEYVGNTRVIACKNGNYQLEPMMLNGKLLSDYAIVYPSTDTMSESLLATRMASELAKMTGAVIPAIPDNKTCSKEAKILIGATKITTKNTEGRSVCTQNVPHEIVIAGDDTAQLSEAITYFLDTLDARLFAGDRVWSFASLDVPVDTSISLMGYNLGAQNDNSIKLAEWELITDYLPDIMTFQEPWAGFLDDFLNSYAVKPTTPFQASTSDDDVMATDVDNKAFTGKGYYGVYWGMPRWVPGGPYTNGKASYSVILYAKDRFTVDEKRSGTFWLSDTPNVVGSKYEDSKHVRCATYATLTDRNTGKTFVVVNTHLQGAMAVEQITVLLRELKRLVGTDIPVFITGDMNREAQTEAIALFKDNEYMDMTAMDEVADRAYRHRRNIDWLFMNCPDQIDVSYYNYCGERPFLNNIWNDKLVMGRPSDHPAVYAEFKFR